MLLKSWWSNWKDWNDTEQKINVQTETFVCYRDKAHEERRWSDRDLNSSFKKEKAENMQEKRTTDYSLS